MEGGRGGRKGGEGRERERMREGGGERGRGADLWRSVSEDLRKSVVCPRGLAMRMRTSKVS